METALVCTMLVTIVYGVVETSFLYRDALVVSAASRAGARVAASLPRDASFATVSANQVMGALGPVDPTRVSTVWVFKADAAGLPDSGGFNSCTTCVKFIGTSTGLAADGPSGWAGSAQNACSGTQDTVGVYVRYKFPSRLGFFFRNQAITESTVMRLEPLDRTGPCKP